MHLSSIYHFPKLLDQFTQDFEKMWFLPVESSLAHSGPEPIFLSVVLRPLKGLKDKPNQESVVAMSHHLSC